MSRKKRAAEKQAKREKFAQRNAHKNTERYRQGGGGSDYAKRQEAIAKGERLPFGQAAETQPEARGAFADAGRAEDPFDFDRWLGDFSADDGPAQRR